MTTALGGRRTRRCGGRSLPAFTLVELLVAIGILGLLLAIALPAVQQVRESARRMECSVHLNQLATAFHTYESTHRVLPYGVGPDANPNISQPGTLEDRRYSAWVMLLPYIDQMAVYRKIDFNVAPFHPYTNAQRGPNGELGVNGEAAQTTIPVFLCPTDSAPGLSPWGEINYRLVTGDTWSARDSNGMFGQNGGIRLRDAVDGLSQTALISERLRGTYNKNITSLQRDLISNRGLWTEEEFANWCSGLTVPLANRFPFDSNSGKTWLEGNMTWNRYNHVLPPNAPSCKNGITWDGVVMSATSQHPMGVHVILADVSVRFVSENISRQVWRAVGSRNGGESVSF